MYTYYEGKLIKWKIVTKFLYVTYAICWLYLSIRDIAICYLVMYDRVLHDNISHILAVFVHCVLSCKYNHVFCISQLLYVSWLMDLGYDAKEVYSLLG